MVQTFLAGAVAVDPVLQGKAAGWHDIETLLTESADKVNEVFEHHLKQGLKTK